MIRRLALLAALGGVSGCEHRTYLDDEVCVGNAGPAMIRIEGACVDSTEVTRQHYADFLSASPAVAEQSTTCAWNTAFEPNEGWPPELGSEHYPVDAVDWCDALAYCTWAGKRLCGKLGGGQLPARERARADSSEWFRACSAGGKRSYPYGDVFDEAACNVRGAVAPVAASAGCEGGSDGIHDMIGNVWEWTDSCAELAGEPLDTLPCDRRGGATTVIPTELDCAGGELIRRNLQQRDTGFRCCAD